jgi:4-amino-4-deoxy-L-arabinose transferase-like glycosyltransferase
VFFLLWAPARAQWRRPGPYLALVLTLLGALPVLIWNARHDWITLTHLEERAGLDNGWEPTLSHLLGFIGAEAGVLNPVFFALVVLSVVAFWRRHRGEVLMVYCFSMGAPLFLFYLLFSLRSPVLANWIAPAVIPLFCLMALYSHAHAPELSRALQCWLTAGVVLGLVAVVVLHDTRLVGKVIGLSVPVRFDPLRRVQGWNETAGVVEAARTKLASEGRPTFVIGDHYGMASLLSFYLPGAREAAASQPRVFCRTSSRPRNQFFFWPGYTSRRGHNAIYVQRANTPRPPPADLVRQFADVTDLGVQPVLDRGRVLRSVQLFACRDLR